MNTERPDNDDAEARTAPDGTRETGGASGDDGRTDARRDREEAATPEPGTARPDTGATDAATATPGAGAVKGEPGSGSDETVVGEHRGDGRHPGEEHPDGSAAGRRRSPALIASVAAAVLLVGGGGAYLAASASGGSGDGGTAPGANGDATPPPLALDGHSEDATNGIAPGEPNPYGASYRADGTLPAGPGSAPVYRVRGQITQDRVVTLAKALGIDGKPVLEGGSWRIGGQDGSGPTLRVDRDAPGAWTFSRYAPGTDDCEGGKCSVPPTGGPVVSEAVAKKAAAPVLKAVGQDDAKRDAGQVMGGKRVVNADPEVGGLPTYGWTTGVVVGARGEVVGGSGRIAEPVKGDTYPVVGAREALDLMNAAPGSDTRGGIGGCATDVPLDGEREEAPCEDTPKTLPDQDTITVEKAVFGLAAHLVDGRPALVPSWLFEVVPANARGTLTVTHPAVDPRYIAPGTQSGEASPAPSTPGDEPTAAPSAREVEVEGYTAEGDELTVTFTGGVCADYKTTASESGDRVTVRVTERPWPDKVCILIAKQFQQTVPLDAPLGDRRVVDTDGEPVPLHKDGARLPAPPTR
ncbi:hypothetical protein [Streptomyces griseoloalbus]|uniref:Large membrane protein n=1 Tax=Streptomyces griseoloalbus TaxID=67303 RepID=A0A7W8BS09_9ACTN|nr:hypothetical protein [Streptomyces albaduncus]MBB5126599.1 hypothetical protein [Streptomyces albaduncus]GGW42265.1 membrane protein [Streptomyces albaduncus]